MEMLRTFRAGTGYGEHGVLGWCLGIYLHGDEYVCIVIESQNH